MTIIDIQAPQQSGTTAMQLTSSTPVFKQVTVAPASMPVGESISAVLWSASCEITSFGTVSREPSPLHATSLERYATGR